MLNILIPLAGKQTFETDQNLSFPRILTDVGGELVIERAAKAFTSIPMEKNIVVAIPADEAEQFCLDKIIPLLGDDISLCTINGGTQGAACSALLAIEQLDLNSPLIISSFEQVFELPLINYINEWLREDVDAGVLTFEAIHPKWSYVKVDSKLQVTQAAEKMPISKNAVAGLYYFKTAQMFIDAAKNMIRKDVKTNNLFFISPVLNEIILNNGLVKSIPIPKNKFFHIYDEHSLEYFEESISSEKKNVKQQIEDKTKQYIEAFDSKSINAVSLYLSEDFKLKDPSVEIEGKYEALKYIDNLFMNCNELTFNAKSILVSSDMKSVIEFELTIDGKTLLGCDIIQWNDSFSMIEMKAYLYEVPHG